MAGLVLVAPAQPRVRGGRIELAVQALFALYAIRISKTPAEEP